IHHRALDPALQLSRLLDLVGDAVEDRVEDSGSLSRLDHRDVEAVEDLRVARHRLREEESSLDVGAELAHDRREVEVLRLLLQDYQRADDVEAGFDHRRELPREDLEGLRLDLLERRACALFAAGGELVELTREQAAEAELL